MRVTASNVGERLKDADCGGRIANAEPWTGRGFAEDAAIDIPRVRAGWVPIYPREAPALAGLAPLG